MRILTEGNRIVELDVPSGKVLEDDAPKVEESRFYCSGMGDALASKRHRNNGEE